jgi:hypothetical protein
LTKSSCFTQTFSWLVFARNILSDLNNVVGAQLSSVVFLSCRSPRTTSQVFKLSRDTLLLTLTLKVSITGIQISSGFIYPVCLRVLAPTIKQHFLFQVIGVDFMAQARANSWYSVPTRLSFHSYPFALA